MDGLGNDFIIIDARQNNIELSARDIKTLANRKTGVGCDQLFILRPSPAANVKMLIFNADGGAAGACGNGARCVADILFKESALREVALEAPGGKILKAYRGAQITVNMGRPGLNWRDIPLAREADTSNMPALLDGLKPPSAVSMGNPHAVFFVEDLNGVNLQEAGPAVENNALFPQRTNVEFAQILSKDKIRMRVWERGAGVTAACGSGACATLVAAVRKGLTNNKADIIMDGGALAIEWDKNGDVLMTGPVNAAFKGEAYLK
jgi:diaminopimelate epimerase